MYQWILGGENKMKEIKFLLLMLSVAAFTSLWWITMAINNRFAPLTVILSAVLLVIAGIYICNHWNDRSKEMREIKFLLLVLFPVTLTSLWWLAMLVTPTFFLPVATLSSVFVIVGAFTYIAKHWKDGR